MFEGIELVPCRLYRYTDVYIISCWNRRRVYVNLLAPATGKVLIILD